MAREQRRPDTRLDRLRPPGYHFASLFLLSFERMSTFQFELLRTYARFSLGQWREALQVRDAAGLRGYFEQQMHATHELAQQVSHDARALLDFGADVAHVQRVAPVQQPKRSAPAQGRRSG